MAGMPGMDHDVGGPAWRTLVLLGLLGLFWAGTVLHVVRLVAGSLLVDRDTPADVAHAVMGVGMVAMLFPGVWPGPHRPAAAGFAVGAAWFLVRALRRDGAGAPPGRRSHSAVIAVTGVAMAAMLGVRSPSSALVGGIAAALLVGCAAAHARILSHRHGRHAGHGLERGQVRFLMTAPGVAGVATTLGMAYMVTAM